MSTPVPRSWPLEVLLTVGGPVGLALLVRGLAVESSFLEAVATSLDSARGRYRRPAALLPGVGHAAASAGAVAPGAAARRP